MTAGKKWREEVASSLRSIIRQAEVNDRDRFAQADALHLRVRRVAETLDRVETALAAGLETDPVADAYGTLVAKRVIVNLLNGSAIDGVLLKADGPLLTLANASYISADGQTNPAPVDGHAIVERDRIEFMQVI